MPNKRKLKRRNLIYYLKVFDCSSGEVLGRLVDVTTGGLMLVSEEPITTDAQLTLRIELPAKIIGKEEISFNATTIWCRKEEDTDYFNTGLRVKDLDPTHLRRIRQLISRYKFLG